MAGFTVPMAERKVTRAQLPGVRQSISTTPGMFGATEAGVISEIGRQVVEVGKELEQREAREQRITLKRQKAEADLQEKKDQMYAKQALLEYQNTWITEKQQFMGTRRLEADGIQNKFVEWHNKTKESLMGQTTNPRQKELIGASLGSEFTKGLLKVTDHENTQLNLANDDLNDSIYTNAVRSVGEPDSTDIDILDGKLTAIRALNDRYAGFDKETKKKLIAEGMSAFHESVIDGKMVGDLDFAQEYFEKIEKIILPEHREKIRAELRKEEITQDATFLANHIALIVDDDMKWQTEVDKQTDDPDVRKEARKILDAKKKDNDAQEKELIDRERKIMLDRVLNAPNLEVARAEANRAVDVDNRELGLATANTEYSRKSRDIETDIDVQAVVKDRINAGEFDELADLTQFRKDLSKPDYNNIINQLQRRLHEERTGKTPKEGVINYKTATDAFSSVMDEKRDIEDSTQNRQFIFVQGKLDDASRAKGDSLTYTEAVKETRKWVVNGEVPGKLFGKSWTTDLTMLEAKAQGRMGEWLPLILTVEEDDNAERQRIDSGLASRGIVTDNEDLKRLFKKDAILGEPLTSAEKQEYKTMVAEARTGYSAPGYGFFGGGTR